MGLQLGLQVGRVGWSADQVLVVLVVVLALSVSVLVLVYAMVQGNRRAGRGSP